MSETFSIRLPESTARALEEVAKATDRPKSYLIIKALDAFLAEYADYQIALDRLRDQKDAILSSAELRKRIGREG
jgi:RHH-type rel operon transcriptional repressor/antitoxin RelB